jgi:pimeloyl-ACP methyl ester carboxylesterase
MQMNSNAVKANGLEIHYSRHGSGAPIVLLHGWPEFRRTWRKNVEPLSAGFDVIAPDLRGFGGTRRLDGAVDGQIAPPLLAEDLAAFLDALGLGRIGLVSHDVGAGAAQAFALRWPERLSGLFFFNCPYPGIGKRWADADQIPEIWYQTFNQQPWAPALVGASRQTCRTYISHFLSHWSHDPRTFDEDLEAWVDNFMQPGALAGGFAWYKGVDAPRRALMRSGPPPEKLLIATPTRVLWGASDPVLRAAWTDRLPDYFSDIEVSIAPEAGHFVHYERPELANAAIVRFFEDRA